MASSKYQDLKKIYIRVHHLYLNYPILITDQRAKALNYDYLKIAEQELSNNLLNYIKIEHE
jgi:hypothetical protein